GLVQVLGVAHQDHRQAVAELLEALGHFLPLLPSLPHRILLVRDAASLRVRFLHLFQGTIPSREARRAAMEAVAGRPPRKEPVMRVLRPVAVPLLLTLLLGAPGFATQPKVAERGVFLHQLRGFLVSLWSQEGCLIDPWGRCLAGAPPRATPAT